MPVPVTDFAAACIGERLYVAGGWMVRTHHSQGPGGGSPALQIYDFGAGTWSIGPPLPRPLYMCAGAAFGSKIFVSGGKHGFEEFADCVVCYDTETGAWAEGPRLPTERQDHTMLVHQNRLLLLGGGDADRGGSVPPLVYVERHSGGDAAWIHDPDVVPPMPPGHDVGANICSAHIG